MPTSVFCDSGFVSYTEAWLFQGSARWHTATALLLSKTRKLRDYLELKPFWFLHLSCRKSYWHSLLQSPFSPSAPFSLPRQFNADPLPLRDGKNSFFRTTWEHVLMPPDLAGLTPEEQTALKALGATAPGDAQPSHGFCHWWRGEEFSSAGEVKNITSGSLGLRQTLILS